jgi:hypothetical protein
VWRAVDGCGGVTTAAHRYAGRLKFGVRVMVIHPRTLSFRRVGDVLDVDCLAERPSITTVLAVQPFRCVGPIRWGLRSHHSDARRTSNNSKASTFSSSQIFTKRNARDKSAKINVLMMKIAWFMGINMRGEQTNYS